ncbi:hypothetical protein V8E53_004561 [Lactarius tabidus]
MLADVRHLSIDEKDLQPSWRDDIDQDEWVPLLRQFTNARLRSDDIHLETPAEKVL